MNPLNRYSIKTQFFSNIGIIIILFFLSLSVYKAALYTTQKGYSEIFNHEVHIIEQTRKIHIAMLEARESERDFMLHKNAVYPPKVEKAVERIFSQAKELKIHANNAKLPEIEIYSDDIRDHAETYLKTFKQIVESYKKKGLDENSGFQGTFRKAAHNFTVEISKHAVGTLIEDLLQLRRCEANYISAKNSTTQAEFKAAIIKYQQDLTATDCHENDKESLLDAMARYRNAADLLLSENEENNNEKLFQNLQEAANETESILRSIYVPGVRSISLEVRQHEKDYLLRGDESYVKQAIDTIEEIKTAFADTTIPQDHLQSVIKNFNTYKTALNALVAEQKHIEKIAGDMRDAVHQIEPEILKITQLAERALKEQSETLENTVRNADKLALFSGGFSLFLGIAISLFITNSIVRALQRAVSATEKIAAGNYDIDLSSKNKDEIGMMLNSLQTMSDNLHKLSEANKQSNWIKSGQSELDTLMRGEKTIEALCREIITFLTKYVEAHIGAFFVMDEQKTLNLIASYAFTTRKNLPTRFEIGKGLVGQAAYEKQSILFTSVPENYLTVTSGLGEKEPDTIMVAPLVYKDLVIGVVELAKFGEFSKIQRTFIENASESIAITINTVQAGINLQTALSESQQLTEELQTQQEELQVANEELLESQSELQAQQEELRVANEELEEKNTSLEIQQKEIKKKNSELEEIANQLDTKAKELEVSSKYKSEFLANMSHELRTPLNSLLILAKEFINNKEGNLLPEQVEYAGIIYNSGNELLALINEILDLSKIEAGKMTLHLEPLRLSTFLNDLARKFNHVAQEKGIDFTVKLEPNVTRTITTDPQKLNQILKNLVANAIKFTSTGGVTVNIGPADKDTDLSRSGLAPHKSIVISVIDTGIGISEDVKLEIFEAFRQADGSTSRKYGGTGLGLSISRELAKILGGEIQLSSEVEKGSTFSLFLPQELSLKSPQVSKEVKTSLPPSSIPTKPKATMVEHLPAPTIADDRSNIEDQDHIILIIEDDLSFAKILARHCHEHDFKFLHAGDGQSGITLAREYLPDGVFLDLNLPGISGTEVLDSLKTVGQTRHIPIYITSVEDEDKSFYQKGIIGYIQKPASEESLTNGFAKIESIANKRVKDLLVVEDDETLCNALKRMMDDESVNVSTATTGRMALDALKSTQFDCLVLDLNLPDISGFELLKEISDTEKYSQPPVIIYTGRELTPEENLGLQEYTNTVILKTAYSTERLLDETSLFLHKIDKDLLLEKRKRSQIHAQKEEFFAGRKILLVDDDMRNLFAISKSLESHGMNIVKAADGKQALELLEKEQNVELVLMDIMMPVMDGYEAMKKIRAQKKFKNLSIIALTAKAMPEDQAKCIDAGANDYITKPVDIDQIMTLMRAWLPDRK